MGTNSKKDPTRETVLGAAPYRYEKNTVADDMEWGGGFLVVLKITQR